MILIHAFYQGIVQGVGFRYTVHRLATGLGLCGWVRNLSDGRVEMKVEGPREAIDEFLRMLEGHFEGSIRSKEIFYEDRPEHFQDFKITF